MNTIAYEVVGCIARITLNRLDQNSFNHAIAAAAVDMLKRKGHSASFHDRNKEKYAILVVSSEAHRKIWLEEVPQTVSDRFPRDE